MFFCYNARMLKRRKKMKKKFLAVLLTLFPFFALGATAQADTVKIVYPILLTHHLNLKILIRLTRGLTLISSTRSQKSKAGTLT